VERGQAGSRCGREPARGKPAARRRSSCTGGAAGSGAAASDASARGTRAGESDPRWRRRRKRGRGRGEIDSRPWSPPPSEGVVQTHDGPVGRTGGVRSGRGGARLETSTERGSNPRPRGRSAIPLSQISQCPSQQTPTSISDSLRTPRRGSLEVSTELRTALWSAFVKNYFRAEPVFPIDPTGQPSLAHNETRACDFASVGLRLQWLLRITDGAPLRHHLCYGGAGHRFTSRGALSLARSGPAQGVAASSLTLLAINLGDGSRPQTSVMYATTKKARVIRRP